MAPLSSASAAPLDPPYPRMSSSLAPADVKKDHCGRDKAAAVFKRELDDFRDDGHRARASSRAPRPSEQQAKCPRPWDSLVWSANQHGHQARCQRSDLKNVLLWSCRHGVLATSSQTTSTLPSVDTDQTTRSALTSGDGLPVGQVILDSGCRAAVAGWRWRRALQEELRRRNFGWIEVAERETSQFGSGQPELSTRAFIYPAGIYGQNTAVRMSAVGGGAEGCPGLVGPSELARWGTCFNFTTKAGFEHDTASCAKYPQLCSWHCGSSSGVDLAEQGGSPQPCLGGHG